MRAQEFDNPKENFVEMFRKFLPLAMEIIGLESLPKMVFEKEVESPDQPTFGQYVNNDHVLHVGLANRHPNDILRTVAHELVHYKQDTEHKLNHMSGNTGSPEENEANALAGIVMRNFNKRYPEYLKVKPVIAEAWSEKYKRSINCSNPKGFSQRAHCRGRKKNESAGDRGNIPTGPGEQLIPFPKGTTMVDVSDVYDWYKLGMVISDLDDADPKIFGQGAPHTVIAFGSEEEEHKLLPLLKRLGLSVHDIDRPEDVKKVIPAKMLAKDLAETIRKVKGGKFRLVSKKGRNLGTYPTRAGAEKRERQVQYFKHVGEDENFNKEAEAWRDWQLKMLPRKMEMLSKLVKGWVPSEEDHIAAIEAGYNAMKNTGDVKDAAKAISDTFNEIQRQQGVAENFADGRNPQDKGDSARHGIRKGMTIAQLKKIRSSKSASPRKKQLAHWQINMRQGRKK